MPPQASGLCPAAASRSLRRHRSRAEAPPSGALWPCWAATGAKLGLHTTTRPALCTCAGTCAARTWLGLGLGLGLGVGVGGWGLGLGLGLRLGVRPGPGCAAAMWRAPPAADGWVGRWMGGWVGGWMRSAPAHALSRPLSVSLPLSLSLYMSLYRSIDLSLLQPFGRVL